MTVTPYAQLLVLKEIGPGQSFYVSLPAKVVTKYAYTWKISVSTHVCLVIENPGDEQPKVRKILKVTRLQ